ncbi:hypothetical protein ACROYT_G020442 [Oculina patagonica]
METLGVSKMERFVCLIVLITLCNANHSLEKLPEGTVIANKSLAAKIENGTIEDGASKVNASHRSLPALLMLSVEIIKNGNRSNSTEKTRDGSEIFVVDGSSPEEISFFEPPKASPYFPRFSEISMRTLYLIVCMCLLILLLMIVKLLVSRRERKKDYDMVTKGEFDA